LGPRHRTRWRDPPDGTRRHGRRGDERPRRAVACCRCELEAAKDDRCAVQPIAADDSRLVALLHARHIVIRLDGGTDIYAREGEPARAAPRLNAVGAMYPGGVLSRERDHLHCPAARRARVPFDARRQPQIALEPGALVLTRRGGARRSRAPDPRASGRKSPVRRARHARTGDPLRMLLTSRVDRDARLSTAVNCSRPRGGLSRVSVTRRAGRPRTSGGNLLFLSFHGSHSSNSWSLRETRGDSVWKID
jgi:hypothetical protein